MTGKLETILRAGDPAAGDRGLAPEEAARMRREILDAAIRDDAAGAWIPAVATGVVAVATLILILLVGLPQPAGPARLRPAQGADRTVAVPPPTEGPSLPRRAERGERPARRIHFVTRGGTRVVWTLDPDFDV